jgi:hypothetical protein
MRRINPQEGTSCRMATASLPANPVRNSYLFGTIRHGRNLETRQAMLRELSEMWTRLTGQSEVEVLVSLREPNPKTPWKPD